MKEKLKLAFFIAFFLCNTCLAQVSSKDSVDNQKDIFDFLGKLVKSEKNPTRDTLSKSGPFYAFLPYPGFAMVTGYLLGITNSISFYTYRSPQRKISTILSETIYSQFQQLISTLNSNIWTKEARFNIIGDWRYYHFPTNTYGIGSKSSLNDRDGVSYSYLKVHEVFLKTISDNFLIGAGINYDYHYNIQEIKNDKRTTDLDKYGFNNTSVSSGFTINLQYDSRLNSNNAKFGDYVNLKLRNNIKSMGSESTWQSILLDVRHYISLSKRTGNVLAFWSYDNITLSGKPPYFDLPSLGWDSYNNTGRGYIQGRFTGLKFLYFETEYRFRLSKNDLLGGVLFANISSFSEFQSDKFEKVNPGEGLGLRIKINKKSGTNLCIDYGFGTGNSRGITFNLNEVF